MNAPQSVDAPETLYRVRAPGRGTPTRSVQRGDSLIRNVLRFLRDESGQDAFEYVLIIGVVVVAVLLAIATPVGSTMINAVLDGVCGAIDAMPGISIVVANCT